MEIELTRLFVKVVQNGSFSKAASLLKIPKSTVSKAVSRLEKQTGTKLLLRTTRSLTLTAAGRAYYETCLAPIQVLEDAEKSLYGQDSILAGEIRLTAPDDLGTEIIAPLIGEIIRDNPGLSFDLRYTDQVLDLVKEGFDLAVRIGTLSESSLKAKKIGMLYLVLVAAPSYVQKAPRIRHPSDLRQHQCLMITTPTAQYKWNFRSKRGETAQLSLAPKIQCNQMTSLIVAAQSGAGVALVPINMARREIKAGRLVRILPDWSTVGTPVSLLSPVSSTTTARLKLVGDQISERVRAALRPD